MNFSIYRQNRLGLTCLVSLLFFAPRLSAARELREQPRAIRIVAGAAVSIGIGWTAWRVFCAAKKAWRAYNLPRQTIVPEDTSGARPGEREHKEFSAEDVKARAQESKRLSDEAPSSSLVFSPSLSIAGIKGFLLQKDLTAKQVLQLQTWCDQLEEFLKSNPDLSMYKILDQGKQKLEQQQWAQILEGE